jgi:Mg-chelatase subunit ChlD
MTRYAHRAAFGLATFESEDPSCTDHVNLLVAPTFGSESAVSTAVDQVSAGDSSNIGPALRQTAATPALHDSNRPTGAIVLLTDGAPNCAPAGAAEPAYTVAQARAAAAGGVAVHVVGFGGFAPHDAADLDAIAQAGGAPCSGASCGGHSYYPVDALADADTALAAILDSIALSVCGH